MYRYDSLDGFLRVFWLVQSTLASGEDWARLAYESVIDGAVHGLVHREAFFTPARHLANGQDLAATVAGLDDGLAAAEAETGVTCLLIADMDRACGPTPGLELVERLAELRRSAVPASSGSSASAWTRPSEASIRCRTAPPSSRRGPQGSASPLTRARTHRRSQLPPASTSLESSGSITACPSRMMPSWWPASPRPGSHSRCVPDVQHPHRERVRATPGPQLSADAGRGPAGHAEHRRPSPHRARSRHRVPLGRRGLCTVAPVPATAPESDVASLALYEWGREVSRAG